LVATARQKGLSCVVGGGFCPQAGANAKNKVIANGVAAKTTVQRAFAVKVLPPELNQVLH
jgi:hypothetical protein